MTLVPTAARIPARVLIVTSDAELARQLTQTLHRLGCEAVEIARDELDASARCRQLSPQLTLIDLQWLGSSTPVAIAAQLAQLAPAPIVYLGDAEIALPVAAAVNGVAFIDKPLSERSVARAIGFACARHERDISSAAPLLNRDALAPDVESQTPEASRLTPELLGSMAHELRAPLQGVMGFATFLRDGKAGAVSETQQQYLDHIATGANHVLQVVTDVLDLTATDSDTLHVRTEPVDPEQAAREVLQVLQVIAIRRRVAVQVSVDEQLGHVVSDATKIKQVLYNFVSNAIKFTPAGGRVTVTLRRDGLDSFCIEVADTGVGIAQAAMATVFERAVRGPNQVQGLGLFLTKRIVDALGGVVSVERRSEGGSLFSARLPISPSVADRRAQDILLADDP